MDFTVTNLNDAGIGSLRWAIDEANRQAGFDQIRFDSTLSGGTISLAADLASITDQVAIQGLLNNSGRAAIAIDFNGHQGLIIQGDAASGSSLTAVALMDAGGDGLTLDADNITVQDCLIGVDLDGSTAMGNQGHGIRITAESSNNLIGTLDPLTGVPLAEQVSNVISANGGDGILVQGGDHNTIANNRIGTSADGTADLGNGGRGISLTARADHNQIGGIAHSGNDPTKGEFERPGQGNLISGNGAEGVRISEGSRHNDLFGNFIGTDASGTRAISNDSDGVAIIKADHNNLIGTTRNQSPFIYYNVVSGNQGNGLHVNDSNHITIHANFFGLGANNATRVPNGGDGVLVTGDSWRIDAGGEIPLGNVMSGNSRYGIEVRDTASGFVSFNSFVGQVAFGGLAANAAGGIRITSSNPRFDPADSSTWNRIRTSLIGGNWGNGVEFLGNAYGAEITDTAVGTTADIEGPLPNLGNGIVVGGNASKIAIGGFQPSIEQADGGFSVHVGSNTGYGIVFQDSAHDNYLFNTRVGIGVGSIVQTAYKLPNAAGGIFVGPGTSRITIGGVPDLTKPLVRYACEIIGNRGNGITVVSSKSFTLLGCTVSGNAASGLVLNGASGATIGAPTAGNIVARNKAFGLFATGSLSGSTVQSSVFSQNGSTGVRLAGARGLTLGGATPDVVNLITGNKFWGLFASGWCKGSTISGNVMANNTPGDVNTKAAVGLKTATFI